VKRALPLIVLVALVAAGGWWWLRRGGGSSAGMVHLEWQGTHAGSAVLPGQVAWCPVTRMATLSAISNDTGLIVSLLEADSISAAPHPVVAPAFRDSAPRPSGIAALRWAGDTGVLFGFRSASGLVELKGVGSLVSGSFNIRMSAPVGADTLVVRGDFLDLPVVTSAVGCP
jgi:hypothetical protein